MKRKAVALFSVLALLCMVSCGASDDKASSQEVEEIIIDADEVKYNTVFATIDSIGPEYYAEGEFRNPYSQNVFIIESGIVSKLFAGTQIEEGDLICEELIDGLSDEIDKQKLITDAAEETYNNLLSSGVKGTELEYAQINYESEKNKYDKLLEKEQDTKIYAPCSGTIKIDRASVYAGAQVYAGQYLCEISDSKQRYLCAFVYQEPLKDVNFGSKVQIKQGNVVDIESKVIDIIYYDMGSDFSGYYYVIETPDDAKFLDFGKIDIIFNVNKKEGAVVVPVSALKQTNGRKYVNVLIDGTNVEIDVETGITTDFYVEIVSGLSGGEEIIIN